MIRKILRWFFHKKGWYVQSETPAEVYERSVVTAAPHTTWWDILYTIIGLEILGVNPRIGIAKKYAKWPIRKPLENFGAIWIDRSPRQPGGRRKSYIEAVTELFEQNEKLALVLAPEGTRSLRTKWKTGFYYMAQSAKVPIVLGYLDYKKREAGLGITIHPSEDMDADMRKIMAFYKDIHPKFPARFSLDEQYI